MRFRNYGKLKTAFFPFPPPPGPKKHGNCGYPTPPGSSPIPRASLDKKRKLCYHLFVKGYDEAMRKSKIPREGAIR